MKYSFSGFKKIVYLCKFLFDKLVIPFEVRIGLFDILRVEILWLIGHNLRIFDPYKLSYFRDYFETYLGKFFVAPNANGTYIVSPAFEKTDREYLFTLIDKDLQNGKTVLFLDVGAYFGLYSVAVGNRFKSFNKQLKIIAFEPEASNFFDNNCQLIRKNIKVNTIKNFTLFEFGLGSKNTSRSKKFEIPLKRLDSFFSQKFIESFDSVYMKLDIEGGETDALIGAEKSILSSRKFYLMVEDFVDTRILDYLQTRFTFIDKISPLNSFWLYEKS